MKIKYVFLSSLFFLFFSAIAQQKATIKEFKKSFLTYPFSDPDPIPSENKIYPYFRFDGFTSEGNSHMWKVIELENDFIKIHILPEIGGKIWAAWDKGNNEAFLYNNEVVKFRDIALRGPWVSGGIEFNYGIIGHTPNSANQVDYFTRENEDGSASYFVSHLDLLTRTKWVLEVKLEKDKAFFTTHSYWFNTTPLEQPYYTWMNAGIPAGKDLQFLYPGSHYISHGGDNKIWALDEEDRNLSFYAENNFGGSKSYHVLGKLSRYFGGYWKDKDFGMIHYAPREDKLGKKIFLWAQSDQGRIWEDLLTDSSGQYVEIQSGRLFNQNVFESSLTPFKQLGFSPFNSEEWVEYWYPFKGIEGFTTANALGAFNFEYSNNGELIMKFSPVQKIQDKLTAYSEDGEKIQEIELNASPLKAITKKLIFDSKMKPAYFKLKEVKIELPNQNSEYNLDRPLTTPEGFEEDSSYGLYLQGRDLFRFRNYEEAEIKIKASLNKDSLFLPSLVEMSKIKIFRMEYQEAFKFARLALSIDTYNPQANYYYGLSALELQQENDALDGFEVASLSPGIRNAAFTQLSRVYLKNREYLEAKNKAKKSLIYNRNNLEVLKLLYVIARIENDVDKKNEYEKRLLELDPLNHFIRFEQYLISSTTDNKDRFRNLIKNELPFETYLELAIWYYSINRIEEAKHVLKLAPKHTIGSYWLAWLNHSTSEPDKADAYLKEANESSLDFVFPFREETANVLKWALKTTDSWKSSYLLALIQEFRGNKKEALRLLDTYGEVDFAPFYIVKARLIEEDTKTQLKLIKTAVDIDPNEWRFGRLLAKTFIKENQPEKAVGVLRDYYKANKDNYVIGLELVNAFTISNQYEDAEELLDEINILPFEGANEARQFYRKTKLMLAYNAVKKTDYSLALEKIEEAEKWPKNLGVGKPYAEMIDNKLEDAMKTRIYKEMGDTENYEKYKEKSEGSSLKDSYFLDQIEDIVERDERLF